MRKKNVIFRLGQDNENEATELLVNLMQPRYLRTAILSELGLDEDSGSFEFADIDTQVTYEEGRPDIVIENYELCVWIEVKINRRTGFTENQKKLYLKRLGEISANKKVYLILLLPSGYEINEELKTSLSRPGVNTLFAYWEDILGRLAKEEVTTWNPVLAQAIDYLSDRIIEKSIEASFSIKEVILMLNPETMFNTITFIEKLANIIGWETEECIPLCSAMALSASSWSGINGNPRIGKRIGKWMNLDGNTDVFIGIDFGLLDSLKKNDDGFLSLSLSTVKIKNKAIKEKWSERVHQLDDGRTYYCFTSAILDTPEAKKIVMDETKAFLNSALMD